jgi:hypothetical protein
VNTAEAGRAGRQPEPPGGPPLSAGLADALDLERARSLADEGGAAGAIVEADVVDAELVAPGRRPSPALTWRLAVVGAALLAAYALRRSR